MVAGTFVTLCVSRPHDIGCNLGASGTCRLNRDELKWDDRRFDTILSACCNVDTWPQHAMSLDACAQVELNALLGLRDF